jgi:outer membrane protein TolC
VKKFSLHEVQEYAVQHNYEAKKSQMDVAAAQKKLKETVASGLPQVTSTIGYLNNLELTTVLIPNFFEGKFEEKIPVQFGTQHNANLTVTIDQLIFNGSYFVGLKTSKIYQQLADQGLERTQLDVKETVTSTYFVILVSEESQRIIRSNLENLEKTLYEIQERYKEGFVEETDVDLVQISVTALKNSLQNVQKQTHVAYNLLKFQMGLDLNEELQLQDNLENLLNGVDIKNTLEVEFDLEQNIDYRLLNTQEKLSELALKNEKAKYWPTVSAYYSYHRNAFRDSFSFFDFNKDWFRAQVIGVNINIPIFKSGAQKARVQQAAIVLDQARNATRQASQGLLLEDTQAQNNLKSAYESYLNTKENVELSERVYEKTLIKYQEGLASSLDLTQANDKYLQSQSNLIQALSELLDAKNRLDRIRNNY